MDPIEPPANYAIWRLCAWAGPVFLLTLTVAFAGIGKFFPPPLESWSPDEVYRFYLENSFRIRLGMDLSNMSLPLYMVFSVFLSRVMMRAEGRDGIMSSVELAGGVLTTVAGLCAFTLFLSAGFDTAAKAPTDIKAMSDLGWMFFNATVGVTIMQLMAVGVGFLSDRRTVPLVPANVCWFSFGCAAFELIALLPPFFNHGPFAWHGMMAFYVVLSTFFIWTLVIFYFTLKAVGRLEAEASSRATMA